MKKYLKPAVAVLSALSLSASAGEFPDNTEQGAGNQKISQVKTETAQKTHTTLNEDFSRKYFNEQHTNSQEKKEAVESGEILKNVLILSLCVVLGVTIGNGMGKAENGDFDLE